MIVYIHVSQKMTNFLLIKFSPNHWPNFWGQNIREFDPTANPAKPAMPLKIFTEEIKSKSHFSLFICNFLLTYMFFPFSSANKTYIGQKEIQLF